MKHTFTVIIERGVEGGFIASVSELPGCHSQGDTLEELRANIREAVELYLDGEDFPEGFPQFIGLERIEVES